MAEASTQVRRLGPEDNAAILALEERAVPPVRVRLGIADRMTLVADRSPDFFAMRRDMGGLLNVLGAFEGDDLTGVVSVVRRRLTWDGNAIDCHYTGDMLVDPTRRSGRSFFCLRSTIQDELLCGGMAFTHVLEANRAVRAGLSGRARLRAYEPVDAVRYVTWPVLRPIKPPRGYDVKQVAARDSNSWCEGYERYGRDWNLVPVDPPVPLVGERRLVVSRAGEVKGIASLIDGCGQRVVARGLTLKNQLYRHAHNAAALCAGSPRLPGIGVHRPRMILANLLYDRAEPDAALALFAVARDVARGQGLPLLFTALSERDPLLPLLQRRIRISPVRVLALATSLPEAADRPTLANVHQI